MSAMRARTQATTTTAPWSPPMRENIKNNVEALAEENVRFMNPFMAFTNEEILTDTLVKEFSRTFQIPAAEVRMAAHAA